MPFKQGIADLRDLSTLEQVLQELPDGIVDRVLSEAHSTALRVLRIQETRPPPGHGKGDRLREWIEGNTFQEGDTENHCWVFPWVNPHTGMGEIFLPNKKGTYTAHPVHRVYYKLVHGPDSIPAFHYLVHTCANRQCIRPLHMQLERGEPQRRRYGPVKRSTKDTRSDYQKAVDAIMALSESERASILGDRT